MSLGIFCFGNVSSVQAATYYVSTLGTDNTSHGTSTGSGAWKTLDYALMGQRVAKGDIINIEAGTYNQLNGADNRIQPNISTTSGSGPVIIQAYPGGAVVTLDMPTSTSPSYAFIFLDSTKWTELTFKHINFTNSNSVNSTLFWIYGHTISIENCTIDMNSAGKYIINNSSGTGSTTISIAQSIIKNGGTYVAIASSQPNAAINISSSLFYNFSSYVINVSAAVNSTITNNTFFTAYRKIYSSATGCVFNIKNNIFYTNTTTDYAPFYLTSSVTDNPLINVTNNVWYRASGYQEFNTAGNHLQNIDGTNHFINPQFTSTSTNDFTIRSGSFICGRGSQPNLPSGGDINGDTWSGKDIGAYKCPSSISPVNLQNKVAFIGDSIMLADPGTASNFNQRTGISYAPTADTAISGATMQTIFGHIDTVMMNDQPNTVFLSIGINNLATQSPSVATTQEYANYILEMLKKIQDWGATPIWLGIGTLNNYNSLPDTNIPLINNAVKTGCDTNGWKCLAYYDQMMLNPNWQTATPNGYYDTPGNVHPNSLGHAVIGSLAEYLYFNNHTIGTDKVDIGAGARIYANGKFRDLNTTSSNLANISIAPSGGWGTGDYSQWMDTSIDTWNTTNTYYKKWTESAASSTITTAHTIGDLRANQYYQVKVGGTVLQTLQANGSGQISFTYSGGYSTKTFEVQELTAPTISNPIVLTSSAIRWNFTDNADNEIGFRIYTNADVEAVSSATTNLTSLTETGLSENTQYTGRYIKAYNSYGESAASGTAASKYTLVDTPTGFTYTPTRDSISLSVDSFPNPSSGSSGYYFYRESNQSHNSGWIHANGWQDTGLTCGTNYTYKVKYRNGDSVETSAATLAQNTEPCVSEGGASVDAPRPSDLPNSPELALIDTDQKPTPPTKTILNPQGDFNIVVNGDAEYTNSRTVKLKLLAGKDTKYMLVSENANFTGAVQEKYVPDKTWTLSRSDGKKTIYAKFLTLYDVASEVVSDSVILDTTAPNLSITEPKNYSSLTDNTPTIQGTSEPDSSIVLELQTQDGAKSYYSTETDSQGNWEYTFLSPLRNQDYTLNITSQDQAENISKVQTIHFKIQTEKVSLVPELPALTPLISPPAEEKQKITPPSIPEEQPSPEQEEAAPSLPKKEVSLPPLNLQSNVLLFKSLYGNISLKTPLTLISGQKLKAFLKPVKPVKAVKITIIFQKPAERDTSYETKNSVLSSILGIPSAQAQTWRIAEYTLTDENNDGIYEGEITLPETTGTYLIRTTLFYTDGTLENLDTETLIDPKGYIYTPTKDNQEIRINKASISLYTFNPETSEFELWQSTPYGQENPQTTDKTGEYEFLVPEGRYYLQITAKGYQTYKGEEFQAQEGDVIHQNIELTPEKKVNNRFFIMGSVILILVIGAGVWVYKKRKG